MTTYIAKNMGLADRLLRGGLGGYLLFSGFKNVGHGGLSRMILGGVLLTHSLSGYDPLLAGIKSSTKLKGVKKLFGRMKQAMPGHGDKPIDLQQPIPKHLKRVTIEDSNQTVTDFLAVGI
jgi:hypothetical protein